MDSREWQARIDADALTKAQERSTWAAEARKHCPSCVRPVGSKHDSLCKLAGTEVAKGADV